MEKNNKKNEGKKMDEKVLSAVINGVANVAKEGVGAIGKVFSRSEKEPNLNSTLNNSSSSDGVFKASQITDADVNLTKEYKSAPISDKCYEAQLAAILQDSNLSAEEKNILLDELNRKYMKQKEHSENRASEESHRKHVDSRITGVLIAVATGVSTSIPIVMAKLLKSK